MPDVRNMTLKDALYVTGKHGCKSGSKRTRKSSSAGYIARDTNIEKIKHVTTYY